MFNGASFFFEGPTPPKFRKKRKERKQQENRMSIFFTEVDIGPLQCQVLLTTFSGPLCPLFQDLHFHWAHWSVRRLPCNETTDHCGDSDHFRRQHHKMSRMGSTWIGQHSKLSVRPVCPTVDGQKLSRTTSETLEGCDFLVNTNKRYGFPCQQWFPPMKS